MLALLLIIGGVVPSIYAGADFQLSILSRDGKVITGRFLDSLLLTLPPCSYAGQKVDLEYINCDTNQNYFLNNAFTVPSCNSSGGVRGSTLFRNIGYRLRNLTSGTQYKITYKIGNITSTTVVATTRKAADYNHLSLGYQGRSASMLVITVILSVAMFVLMICVSIGVLVTPS